MKIVLKKLVTTQLIFALMSFTYENSSLFHNSNLTSLTLRPSPQVLIYRVEDNTYYYERGGIVPFDKEYWNRARDSSSQRTEVGWNYTVGEVMRDMKVAPDHKNWMKTVAGKDRADQISEVFDVCWKRYNMRAVNEKDIMGNVDFYLGSYISFKLCFTFFNSPCTPFTGFKKSVVFQDLGSVMANRKLFDILMFECEKRLLPFSMNSVDYVVGIGARGFYLGPLLAERFGCGFVPIRKKGKLPGKTLGIEYGTEYSLEEMEVQMENIREGAKVLIVDDLVATGGSLEAACILLRQREGVTIAGCFCPLKVPELVEVARAKLEKLEIKLLTL